MSQTLPRLKKCQIIQINKIKSESKICLLSSKKILTLKFQSRNNKKKNQNLELQLQNKDKQIQSINSQLNELQNDQEQNVGKTREVEQAKQETEQIKILLSQAEISLQSLREEKQIAQNEKAELLNQFEKIKEDNVVCKKSMKTSKQITISRIPIRKMRQNKPISKYKSLMSKQLHLNSKLSQKDNRDQRKKLLKNFKNRILYIYSNWIRQTHKKIVFKIQLIDFLKKIRNLLKKINKQIYQRRNVMIMKIQMELVKNQFYRIQSQKTKSKSQQLKAQRKLYPLVVILQGQKLSNFRKKISCQQRNWKTYNKSSQINRMQSKMKQQQRNFKKKCKNSQKKRNN
eukprot:TRINITY_DN4359_c0_g1_i1.p1 TRINITY_DN4359_c0_g1~~TRINITY_DN4359_c0_g1_i1.p1  ORF type:complete len:343 (-),score=50.98 TRINITY_DN4359_c0_g1_i1:389-1417(-)